MIQAVPTFFILWVSNFDFAVAFMLGALDFTIHYHIDWAKVQINNAYRITPAEPPYWWLLGLDQMLHYLTYVLITYIALSYR